MSLCQIQVNYLLTELKIMAMSTLTLQNVFMDSLVKTTGTTLTNSLLDGWDIALEILLIVMALDYLTGVVAAFRTKTVSSSAGYSGLVKKASIFIIVILAAQMDRVIGNDNHIFRNCTALFFTANDAISILENAGKMGMKLPAFLKNALVKLQQQNEKALTVLLKHTSTFGVFDVRKDIIE